MASTPRFFHPQALKPGALTISAQQAPHALRHLQVLRLDAKAPVVLFDGRGGQWQAQIVQTRKHEVLLQVLEHQAIEREASVAVHLALGMPANDRMDYLVEKATELGVASIQPLTTSRSVLRLADERAAKKVAHWQAIAVAACEQSGRNRVPRVHPVCSLESWLNGAGLEPLADAGEARWLLSLAVVAKPVGTLVPHLAPSATPNEPQGAAACRVLSGPEGGLTTAECDAARGLGFVEVSLGPRVLRADTAPLAALACLAAANPTRNTP